MFSVYILYSIKFDKYYTGQTNDIANGVSLHNKGLVKSTKPYIPYELVWTTQKDTRSKALLLERKLKNLKSKIRLKKFIEKYS